ncbi:MAG: tetratricopeptide repeat protein [Bdellovibrionaceae bacterium]|nr:tetratricopeptide repeat protein [Pseudobdellovibrionaceae bacterium]
MKFHVQVKSLIFTTLVFYFATALGNSNEARSILIKKFEKVRQQLSLDNPVRNSVSLRLADLLSERARISAMEELDRACVVCKAGEKDRTQAIDLYKEALPSLKNEKRGLVLAQLGHLLELNQRANEAEQIYKDIIKENADPASIAEAKLSLAEMSFKKSNYEEAYQLYEQVLIEPKAQRKALAAYRQAWCKFNLGKTNEAVEKMEVILRTPSLLSKTSDGTVAVDDHYKAEVSKDYSTFIAKKGSTIEDIKKVYQLSPESSRLTNINYLASELERLGQKEEAIEAFEFVLKKEENPTERLNYRLHLAQLYKDQKDIKSSLDSFQKALQLQKTLACENDSCDEVMTRLRKYVLDWHTEEKNRPSPSLLNAYTYYIESFPNEVDMGFWQIEALKVNQAWLKAIEEIQRIQRVYHSQKQTKGKNNLDKLPDFENVLLMQVEIAELSKMENLKNISYQNYLANSKAMTKKLAIKYQLAHLKYKNKEYLSAAKDFKELALMEDSDDSNIKIQSADLALDALVILKDDKEIEQWSNEFAKSFPEKKQYFLSISRKSVFNQATQLAQTEAGILKSWDTLKRVDLDGASPEEKRLYYRNRLILAEKLNHYTEARAAVNELLQMKDLSVQDQQWALSRQVWLAELALDFGAALKATHKLNMKPYVPESKDLKLAFFAELSGNDALPYYQNYMRQSKDEDQQLAVALKLIENSSDPIGTLKKYKKYFKNNPETYSSLFIEYLASKISVDKSFPVSEMKHLESDKSLVKTPAYLFAWKHNFLNNLSLKIEKLASHQLDASHQNQLTKSLKERVRRLDELEQLANHSIQVGEWSSQLYTIHHLAIQTHRFYEELLALPMPEGLTEEEQMQYMQLLSQQAAPYKMKYEALLSKESGFWSVENLIEKLKQKYQDAKIPLRPFIKRELQILSKLAPENIKIELAAIINYDFPKKEVPVFAELESARDKVRKNPMDVLILDSLIELEKRSNNKNMVNYLISRRQQINDLKGNTQ